MDDQYYINIITTCDKLNERTRELYLKKLHIIQHNFYSGKHVSIDYVIHNPSVFLQELNTYAKNHHGLLLTELGDHSKESFISPIKTLFLHNKQLYECNKDLYEEWILIHDIIRKPIDYKYATNVPTERQKNAYISYDDIVLIRNALPIGSYERLLFSMYTYIPPVRSDYNDTLILNSKPDMDSNITSNFIVMNHEENYLCLQKYKTVKTYGIKVIDLPDDLVKEIKSSLEFMPRPYLFISTLTNNKYNNGEAFNAWANRRIKSITQNKNMTLTMLRHIYICRRDLMLEEKSGLEREQISKIMGHSLMQQQKYLWHTWLRSINE